MEPYGIWEFNSHLTLTMKYIRCFSRWFGSAASPSSSPFSFLSSGNKTALLFKFSFFPPPQSLLGSLFYFVSAHLSSNRSAKTGRRRSFSFALGEVGSEFSGFNIQNWDLKGRRRDAQSNVFRTVLDNCMKVVILTGKRRHCPSFYFHTWICKSSIVQGFIWTNNTEK